MNWEELEELDTLHTKNKLSPMGEDIYHTMLNETEKEEEHPDWYDSACFCKLCMSYT